MNIHEFVDELRGHFNTPKNIQRVYEVLKDRLKTGTSEDLKACAEKLITTRTSKSWPPVSIILQALVEVQRQRRKSAPAQGFGRGSAGGDLQWDYYRGTTELPVLERGSPPWLAWLDYRRVHGQRIDFMQTRERWTVPTIWPPGYERHKEEYITRAKEAENDR